MKRLNTAFAVVVAALTIPSAAALAQAGDAAKGEASYDHGAKAFVELLHDVAAFDLAQLGDGPLKK